MNGDEGGNVLFQLPISSFDEETISLLSVFNHITKPANKQLWLSLQIGTVLLYSQNGLD